MMPLLSNTDREGLALQSLSARATKDTRTNITENILGGKNFPEIHNIMHVGIPSMNTVPVIANQ